MTVPTLVEFEFALSQIASEVMPVLGEVRCKEIASGNLLVNGEFKDSCSVGSTVLHLDRRKPLFKFFDKIPKLPMHFYHIEVWNSQVQISLRNLNTGQSYLLNRTAYELVASKLSARFQWESFCNVRLD